MTDDEMRKAYISTQIERLAQEPDAAKRERGLDEMAARVRRLFPMPLDELKEARRGRE